MGDRIKQDLPDEQDKLDPTFYRHFYSDLERLTDEQAFAHWTQQGAREKRSPNFAAYLAANPDLAARLPENFSPMIYRYLNPDVADKLREEWQVTLHYLQSGFREGRKFAIEADYYPSDGGIENGSAPAAASPGSTKTYRSFADMLQKNGITSAGFMADFDVPDYLTLNARAGLNNKLQCVRHFAETGRHALCPIAIDFHFDPAFYAEQMPAAPDDPVDAYLHWINVGHPTGIKPNAPLLMKSMGLRNISELPASFNVALYLAFNPDIEKICNTRWDALRHLINHGIIERRKGCPEPEKAADLYLAAADTMAVGGRLSEARWVYDQVLSADPTNGFALRHYGDCLLRLSEFYVASQIYQRAIDLGKANFWTYFNLARCHEELGQFGAAAKAMAGLRQLKPGDVGIATRIHDLLKRQFDQKAAEASRLAAKGLLRDARELMAQAARTLAEPALAQHPGVIKARRTVRSVAIVADVGLAQCRFYRVDQKVEQLREAGLTVQVFDYTSDLEKFPAALSAVDAVIFYRVPVSAGVVEAIEAVRLAGLPSFYELDDLLFDEQHFPDSFASYGGQISEEVYAGLVTGTGLIKTAMALCDYALASTPALAERMERLVRSGRAFLHRNALGASHLAWLHKSADREPRQLVRVFYGTGTRAHNQDFETLVAPALARLLTAHPLAVSVVVMGYLTLPACLKPFAARITVVEPVFDMQVYWTTLAEMDINLAVLKPGVLADCKSEIKWLEAAMLRIPSVMSRTRTYAEVIKDGVDGILADTPEDWFNALDALVRNPARRQQMGAAAYQKVATHYALDVWARNLVSIMNEVTEPARAVALKPKRKVLVVNVYFPPQAVGGATRVVADNVRDLIALFGNDLDVEVFTTTEGGQTPYALRCYEWNGLKVTAITASDKLPGDFWAEDPRMAVEFGAFLDQCKPDLIHFHCLQRLTAAVCQAARERAIRYFVTVHDGWWVSDSQFLLGENLQLDIYRHADRGEQLIQGGPLSLHRMQVLAAHLAGAEKVLAVSAPFAEIYRSCGFANVHVVENGISPLPFRPRTTSPDGRVRLGHIGGAAPHKGFNLLKAALSTSQFHRLSLTVLDHALLPGDDSWTVWGATPVHMQARRPQQEVVNLYADMDVLVAPSLWPESFGLVVREAIQAGCWVIASDRGAIGGDIQPGNGFVVDVQDIEALRSVLAEMNENPGRYLGPTQTAVNMRHSEDQARELAELYLQPERVVAETTRSTRRASPGRVPTRSSKPVPVEMPQ